MMLRSFFVKFRIIFLFIIILLESVYGQKSTITGKVQDSINNPVAGASVIIKGTRKGTTTDGNGNYSINAPTNASLIFSSIGMDVQSIPIEGRTILNVHMKNSNNNLTDVVVIGYGAVKKRNLIGSVASISEKDIQDRPITRIDQALAGQMPGVQVQSISGAPGAAVQIRVRGLASISGSNDPIYVLDGVIIDDLSSLDPNNIKSIDILKDASSAAIYGARGSNGVVLITTKKGRKGKPQINFSANVAIQHPEKLIKMLSPQEWIQFRKDVTDSNWVNYGNRSGLNYKGTDPMDFRASELNRRNPNATKIYNTHAGADPTYMYDPYWAYGTDSLDYVDWEKSFYSNPGLQQKYSLGVSGANENTNFLLSGEYLNQEGMVKGTGYKRYGFRTNIETKINDIFSIGLNLNPSLSTQFGPNIEGRGSVAQPAGIAPVQEKGVGENVGIKGTTFYRWNADNLSPKFIVQNTLSQTQLTRIYSNIYLNTHIAPGLDLKTTGAWNSSSSDFKNYIPTSLSSTRRTAVPGVNSTARRTTNRTQYYLGQSVLSYYKIMGDHELNIVGGVSFEDNHSSNTFQSASRFPNDIIYTFDNSASTITASSNNESERKLFSLFGRVLYNFKGKYLVSGSIRRDGSSRFGINSLFGNFPAASFGWRLSDENFMKFLNPFFSEIKLKYSWGIAGNDRIGNSDYPSIGLISPTSYSFGGSQYIGYSQTTISTPNLRWEKTTSNNFGIDISMFKNRVNLSVDYFNKLTKDLLLSAPVAYVTGFALENSNVGSVSNKGVEINLSSSIINSKSFIWSSKLNFSTLKNRVVALSNNNTPIYRGW